ncbi:hypothetical protein BGW80DRAFT_1453270 [Lactifluus volemus]|nr:hypothetical protein BGW80DRAFT_1453270 [Lactifluus volemus]
MATLPMFPLPLPPDEPPSGYNYSDHSSRFSASSTTSVSQTVMNRDTFCGTPRCIVCGASAAPIVRVYRIIMPSESDLWDDLKKRNWIPSQAKNAPKHEPRNGLYMCVTHGALFNVTGSLYVTSQQFIFVNYTGSLSRNLQPYHGKAVALDIQHQYAPFPSLFIIHEMRVRGSYPFQPTEPMMPDDITWQDWISSRGIYDSTSESFIRDGTDKNDEMATASGGGHALTVNTGS